MGNINSAEDPYGYGYGYGNYGYGNGYGTEVLLKYMYIYQQMWILKGSSSIIQLERYYRRYYPQYNSYYSPTQCTTPTAYYNAYQQQQGYPATMMNGYGTASPAYNAMPGYGTYGVPTYQSMYNTPTGYSPMYSGGMPVYGAYNNTYYPNYLQRTYM